ncbi:MAG TPA: sugar phosphate nucleotidyltransferase [Roseiflexaceae bacterium]|nr:sugar phosphate nucleotidyltransferase [Roseiflexaceae bacterium]
MYSVQQGVILAAGRGTRLQPFSEIRPKPLHPICNKPIMQYQVEAMYAAGIQDICIVVGPGGEMIRKHFGNGHRFGPRITYIEDQAPAGIAASLALAEPWVGGPFAVFLGDIFLSLGDMAPALAPMDAGAAGTIVVRRDTPAAVRRNFAVVTERDGRISRVIEKPAEPPTDLKGCGVYVFDRSIFDAIRRTPRSALRNEYEITDAVQILIDMGRPVYAADIVRWDINITFPADLLACNLRVLREQQLDSLVGAGARVSAQTRLASSIVGEQAVVDSPVVLEQCLVLPGARVAELSENAHRCIFGNGLQWAEASIG